MNDHESSLVSTFVIPEKRARYAEFLPKPKRRREIIWRLNSFFDFVPELATQVPRSSPEELGALLRKRDAPAKAYLIGSFTKFDGTELPLVEAIGVAYTDGWGCVVSCLPGRLALYLREFPPGDTYILATRTT